jgi:pyruvate dehydrogenase E1 component alpha subunit
MNNYLNAFKSIALLRIAEEEIANLFLREKIMSFVHFYVGQEAVAVGVSNALNPLDRALGNHRSHGHYLAKGGSLRSMVCEILGKAEGFAGGKGGSMHMMSRTNGFTGTTPILGSITSIAAGSAFTQKHKQTKNATVAYIGDGASEEGGFYETLNLAALYSLPLMIVVENNLYAVNSKIHDRRSIRYNASEIVKGLGVNYTKVDGNDYDEVYKTAMTLMAEVRNGYPAVLECITYRHMAHSAPLFDDKQGYREEDILKRREERDCLNLLKKRLLDEGVSEKIIFEVMSETRNFVLNEIEYALSAKFPVKNELTNNLYE